MTKCRRIAILSLLFLFCFVPLRTRAEAGEAELRLMKASALGLTDWVDDEGYLISEFYEGKTDSELSDKGIDDLIHTVTKEELDIFVSRLNAGIIPRTVTSYQKVSQVNPDTGRTLYTGLFYVDGRLAFCIERSASTPPQGSPTGAWQEVTNDNLRKVLYYGYNGPMNAGYTYVETALAAGEANGDGDNSLGRKVLAAIAAQASPPSTFQVWKVTTNDGSTQDLAFYTVIENGYGRVQKTSAHPDVTNGNTNFSLEGAVYGIYTDAACTSLVGQVATGADGYSNTLSLTPGTYYVKELAAPKGFELSSEVKTMEIQSLSTTTVSVANELKPWRQVEVTKYRENSDIVLEGAVFEHIKPDGSTEQAVTDAAGKITWRELQIGQHQIRELKAPTGYRENLNVIQFTVDKAGVITVTSEVNKGYGDVRTALNEQGNLCVAVADKIGYRFPETGNAVPALMLVMGTSCCLAALRRKKQKHNMKYTGGN